MSILSSCDVFLHDLRATADLVGPLSFSSLALLVAVLALLGDFSRDKVAVDRGFHLLIECTVLVLTFEVLAWVLVKVGEELPTSWAFCSSSFVISVRVLMLLGIGVAAILLAAVVRKLGEILRTRYRS